jgi:hypothetical protein
MKFLRIAVMAVSAIFSTPVAASAQAGGPYAPFVLLLPAGARTLAMGNTGIAGRDDDVLFFNPAQIAIARGTSGSIERYSGASSGGTLSSVTRLTSSAVAIGVSVVDYQPFAIVRNVACCISAFPTGRDGPVEGGGPGGTSVDVSLGYATTIKSIRVGGAAKYVEDEVPGVNVGRGAFDIGLAKDLLRFYTIGLSVQNIGKSMSVPCAALTNTPSGQCIVPPLVPGAAAPSGFTDVKLPLRTTLGGSFTHQLGEFDLVSTAAVSMLRKDFFIPSGGAELGYSWIDGYDVALRAGARRPLPGEGALTGGVGLTMDRLSIDYAFEVLNTSPTSCSTFGCANSHGSRLAHRVGFRIR